MDRNRSKAQKLSRSRNIQRDAKAAAAEVARLRDELSFEKATNAKLRAELGRQEDVISRLSRGRAFRFAQALRNVRSSPLAVLALPFAFAELLFPARIAAALRSGMRLALGAASTCGRLLLSLVWGPLPAIPRNETKWPASEPLISVIITCFNYGRFVGEAVKSVTAQTIDDFEIILVEGGSTDGITPTIVENLEHPQLRKIFQKRKTTVGEDRLAGLEAARGKYIVFLDADDLIAPTYLEKAAVALELTGVDIAYPTVRAFDRDDFVWETGDEFTYKGLAQCNLVPAVAMFRIETWRKLNIGYNTTIMAEDYDFWLRFAERGARGLKIREALMLYRVHGTSHTDLVRSQMGAIVQNVRNAHPGASNIIRVNYVTANQRRMRFLPDRAANLGRFICSNNGNLRIAVATPCLGFGGSEYLLLSLISRWKGNGASSLVYSTSGGTSYNGLTAEEFTRVTPDVFELQKELPPAAIPDGIMHLLKTRNPNILLLVGSRATYELLPRIKTEFPQLRVVDQLYNTTGHLASNREFARYIDFQIVATEETQAALMEKGERQDRIVVMRHGIDMSKYNTRDVQRVDNLPGLPLRAGETLALFAGRFSPEKGVLRFLEIAARSSQAITFALLGDGPMQAQLKARAEAPDLRDRVKLLGFVPDVRPYLRRADVVVIPSDVDGLPLVAIEALALGTPLVASRVGALHEIISTGKTGALVQPSDIDGFVRAIAMVTEMNRHETEEKCINSVRERFDIRDVSKKYLDVFAQLLETAQNARKPEGSRLDIDAENSNRQAQPAAY